MPINAHPEYFVAERKYHEAKTHEQRIFALEEMIRYAPAHKGAENLRAQLKQRLAKLRSEIDKNRQTAKGRPSFSLRKEGAARVALLSIPSAGKSTMLTALTNARPHIADYPFTTTKPEVGIMDYGGVRIQIIEIPAMFRNCAYKGDWPAYFGLVRSADLVILLLDLTKGKKEQLDILRTECERAQIKLGAKKPRVKIEKRVQGGIELFGKQFLRCDLNDVIQLIKDQGYHNATLTLYEPLNLEQLAESLSESLVYLPALAIEVKKENEWKDLRRVREVKEEIFQRLNLLRIFTKSPGKEKDWPPIAFKKGSKVQDLAAQVHKDFLRKFQYAKIWGKSAKYPGQRVGFNHVLADEDVVELHIR